MVNVASWASWPTTAPRPLADCGELGRLLSTAARTASATAAAVKPKCCRTSRPGPDAPNERMAMIVPLHAGPALPAQGRCLFYGHPREDVRRQYQVTVGLILLFDSAQEGRLTTAGSRPARPPHRCRERIPAARYPSRLAASRRPSGRVRQRVPGALAGSPPPSGPTAGGPAARGRRPPRRTGHTLLRAPGTRRPPATRTNAWPPRASSIPSGSPCAAEVPCLVGAPTPITVSTTISVGRSADGGAAAYAARSASRSPTSPTCRTSQP